MTLNSQQFGKSVWFFLPAVILLLGVMPLPYGFYVFLRLVVTASACMAAWVSYRRTMQVGVLVIVSAGVALLFNPLFPVYLTKEIWMPIDLIAAGWFAFLVFAMRSAPIDKVET